MSSACLVDFPSCLFGRSSFLPVWLIANLWSHRSAQPFFTSQFTYVCFAIACYLIDLSGQTAAYPFDLIKFDIFIERNNQNQLTFYYMRTMYTSACIGHKTTGWRSWAANVGSAANQSQNLCADRLDGRSCLLLWDRRDQFNVGSHVRRFFSEIVGNILSLSLH